MFHRMVSIAALLTVSAAAAAAANAELKLSTPLQATLKDNFCLHVSPDAESDAVICLNAGAPLTLVSRLKAKDVCEGEKGYWYKAEVAGGAEGWVFSTYLDIAPVDEGDAGPDGADSG
jgi:hypothetical protein